MHIHAIPAFRDNYIWIGSHGGKAFVVDPGEHQGVLAYLQENRLELEAVLVTHHHQDHTGGVAELQRLTGAIVHAPAGSNLPAIFSPAAEGDILALPGGTATVMETPGHTLDHLSYFYQPMPPSEAAPALFCGDTLFAGGCGRVFEGTHRQMYASLARLASLPPATRVYCAHEYTLSNLEFAVRVDPDNTALQQRLREVRLLREAGQRTIPSSLREELETNPFLRCELPTLQRSASAHLGRTTPPGVETFGTIRDLKNAS